MERSFPNAHVIITLAKPRGKRAPTWKKVHFGAEDAPFAARIRLYHPIRSDTLSSLFRYPAAWGYSRPHEIHLIEAISSIDLIGDAALLEGRLEPSDLLRRNWSERCHLSTRECNRYDLIEESTREMVRFAPKLPVRDSDDFSPPVFAMYVKPGQGLDACLRSVSLLFRPGEVTAHISIIGIIRSSQNSSDDVPSSPSRSKSNTRRYRLASYSKRNAWSSRKHTHGSGDKYKTK